MNIDKKHLVYAVICVSLLIIGLSFAYFRTNLVGDDKTITIVSDHLRIIFTDNATITANKIMPDWSTSKTFTVTNESGNSYKYDILIEDLVNTFVTEGFLQYKITSDNNGYNMNEWVDVPKRSTATDTVLAHSVEIASGVTQTYTIEFRYPNSTTVNQNADQGKIFTGALAIDEGTTLISFQTKLLADNPTIVDTNDTNFKFSYTANYTNTGELYFKSNSYTEDVTGDGVGEGVYFFRGDAQNNWVKFGKEQKSICKYNGTAVWYEPNFSGAVDLTNTKTMNLTEDECLSTNICHVTVFGDIDIYFSGLTDDECTYEAWGQTEASTFLELEKINEKATYDGPVSDIYWRIIRTNEQGGVRLLYAGNSPDTVDAYIAESHFAGQYDAEPEDINEKYNGYMYGSDGSLLKHRENTQDSFIKSIIDSWYSQSIDILADEKNFLYGNYVSKSAIYCNDRSRYNSSGTYVNGASHRLEYAAVTSPSYRCGRADSWDGTFDSYTLSDKFSVSTTSGGNGYLTYPVALMTADEVAFAGGVVSEDLVSPFAYYFTNSLGISITGHSVEGLLTGIGFWWTMTPSHWSINGYHNPVMFGVRGNAALDSTFNTDDFTEGVVNNMVVRPVLSLKSCVNYKSGDGSSTNPYEVWVDYDCANNEDI